MTDTIAYDLADTMAGMLAIATTIILVGLLAFGRWPVRELSGAFLSYVWAFSAQLAADSAAHGLGLWRYEVAPQFLATPLQLAIGLACMFGPLAFLMLRRWRLPHLALAIAAFDAALTPWIAETAWAGAIARLCAVAGIVASAQFLGRATATNSHVRWRSAMQAAAWIAILFWLFPSAVFAQTGGSWSRFLELSPISAVPLALIFSLFLLMGLNAVQEFALRGDGTPFPFDPPKRLVASGTYAYVRNPMQLSICGCLLALGAIFATPWIALGVLEAVILFVVFKHVCAGASTVKRDDPLTPSYQAAVPLWLPRWTPAFVRDEGAADTITCPANSMVGRWLGRRAGAGLTIKFHEEGRYEYRSGDGRYGVSDAAAVGHALQHVNLAVAVIGWLLCLLPISRRVTSGGDTQITDSSAAQRY